MVDVVVVGDEVDFRCPSPVVLRTNVRSDHEIGRDRNRTGGADDGEFVTVVAEQLFRAEALEVKSMGGVHRRHRRPRREDFAPTRVALAPERGAPGIVEAFDGCVASLEPSPERCRGDVAVAEGIVAPELVRHVPERNRRMVTVSFGDDRSQAQRVFAEYG